MQRLLAPVLFVLLAASVAWADESVEGRITTLEPNGQVLTLEDGTRLTVPSNVLIDPYSGSVDRPVLKPGEHVRASYDEVRGENLVTSIEVTE